MYRGFETVETPVFFGLVTNTLNVRNNNNNNNNLYYCTTVYHVVRHLLLILQDYYHNMIRTNNVFLGRGNTLLINKRRPSLDWTMPTTARERTTELLSLAVSMLLTLLLNYTGCSIQDDNNLRTQLVVFCLFFGTSMPEINTI